MSHLESSGKESLHSCPHVRVLCSRAQVGFLDEERVKFHPRAVDAAQSCRLCRYARPDLRQCFVSVRAKLLLLSFSTDCLVDVKVNSFIIHSTE